MKTIIVEWICKRKQLLFNKTKDLQLLVNKLTEKIPGPRNAK